MKKRILGALAALMVLTVGMTAFAASPSTSTVDPAVTVQKEASALSTAVKASTATMSDGTAVTVTTGDVAGSYLTSAKEFAGAGATVPLTGFGYSLFEGVKKAISENGIIGIFTGGLTATAGGIAAAVVFAFLAALISKPKAK